MLSPTLEKVQADTALVLESSWLDVNGNSSVEIQIGMTLAPSNEFGLLGYPWQYALDILAEFVLTHFEWEFLGQRDDGLLMFRADDEVDTDTIEEVPSFFRFTGCLVKTLTTEGDPFERAARPRMTI